MFSSLAVGRGASARLVAREPPRPRARVALVVAVPLADVLVVVVALAPPRPRASEALLEVPLLAALDDLLEEVEVVDVRVELDVVEEEAVEDVVLALDVEVDVDVDVVEVDVEVELEMEVDVIDVDEAVEDMVVLVSA